jgi:hypothetical protein
LVLSGKDSYLRGRIYSNSVINHYGNYKRCYR